MCGLIVAITNWWDNIHSLSFSLKRVLGITQVKQRIARETGIPTSKAGVERKIGNVILKALMGKK